MTFSEALAVCDCFMFSTRRLSVIKCWLLSSKPLEGFVVVSIRDMICSTNFLNPLSPQKTMKVSFNL